MELVEEEAVAGDEGGLVFGGPCGGVGEAGGVDFSSAIDLAGEIGGLVDADLELAAEADVVVGKGGVGTAAGSGEEALHLGEGFDLLSGSEGKLCYSGVTLPKIRCK